MSRILGIDAGGTHTRCCLADEQGRILSFALGGPANKNFVSPEAAKGALEKGLEGVLAPSKKPADVAILTGAHLHAQAAAIVSACTRAGTVSYVDEFEASLAAGLCEAGVWTPNCPGVVVMAGTGSFCKGRNSKGLLRYAGGWGPLIGDEGSGYDIAREILIAVAKSADGRGEETKLAEMVKAHFAIDDLAELRRVLYNPPVARHDLARLAHYAFQAAERRDAVAIGILREAGRRLARLAQPVVTELFDSGESFSIILSGGIFETDSTVSETLMAEISAMCPDADILRAKLQPVLGAIIIGLDSLGIEIDKKIIVNLKDGNSKMEPFPGKGETKKDERIL